MTRRLVMAAQDVPIRSRRLSHPEWSHPRGDATRTQQVLLVAVCGTSRCAGLTRLRNHPDSQVRRTHEEIGTDGAKVTTVRAWDRALGAAVSDRACAVLLSTGCLGQCHVGTVALVGWAASRQHRELQWIGWPVLLTGLDVPERAQAAADWVRHAAPDVATLPALFHVELPGRQS